MTGPYAVSSARCTTIRVMKPGAHATSCRPDHRRAVSGADVQVVGCGRFRLGDDVGAAEEAGVNVPRSSPGAAARLAITGRQFLCSEAASRRRGGFPPDL